MLPRRSRRRIARRRDVFPWSIRRGCVEGLSEPLASFQGPLLSRVGLVGKVLPGLVQPPRECFLQDQRLIVGDLEGVAGELADPAALQCSALLSVHGWTFQWWGSDLTLVIASYKIHPPFGRIPNVVSNCWPCRFDTSVSARRDSFGHPVGSSMVSATVRGSEC